MKDFALSLLPVDARFRRIYLKNQWGSDESRSGHGSSMEKTERLRALFPALVERYEIRSLVDIACGDLNWMARVIGELPDLDYTGVDIVPELIRENTRKHASDRVRFVNLNVIEKVPPKADAALFRDCILHLSFDHAQRALSSIARSGTPLLLASTNPGVTENKDIVSGRWRGVNLRLPPFNFPEPLESVMEDGDTKALAVWRFRDLPV